MRNYLLISLMASLIALPFVSIAQIRYAVDTSFANFDVRFIPLMALSLLPIVFVYTHGKKMDQVVDKYNLVGAKGGKSKKVKKSSSKNKSGSLTDQPPSDKII